MPMITPLLMAALFIGVGWMLVRAARRSLASGRAVTDENDLLTRSGQPVRFSLFVILQILFGGLLITAGAALGVAALLQAF